MDTHREGRGEIMKRDDLDRSARPAAVWNHWLSSVGERALRASIDASPEESLEEPLEQRPSEPSVAASEPAEPLDDVAIDPASAIAWQRLWLATQRREWRSLAVIPVGGRIATPRVARALVSVGSSHLGALIRLNDATAITIAGLGACLRGLTDPRESAARVIMALGSVLENPASLAVAQAADAAILCLVLGESSISEAERTIEEVGRARFVGSLILR
jgi:hypothetical protein